MCGHFHGWRKCVLGLIALAVFALWPAAARAEDLYFRNDTGAAIIVQGSCLIRGKLVNDRPNLLQPGDKARISLPGNRFITISEARAPNRVLLNKAPVAAAMDDQYFLITPDPRAKVKVDRTTAKEFAGKK
jgi:hypothetical protein